jgi:NADPH2:quinone reductase
MNAIVLDADDKVAVTAIDAPSPGAGQVAIRVAYAGIQWGDVLVRQGHFPVPRPFVPGFEAAGEVVAVGEGVDAGRIGERVAALTQSGAFADVVLAEDVLTFGVDDLELKTAAGFGWVTPTAYALVNEVGRLRAGESILIHGAAGGVGSLAGQFAELAGAARTVGVVLDEEQRAYAKQFSYDEVILASEFPAALGDEVFDVILDPIGGDTRLANLERLAPHGRLVAYGNIATFAPVQAEVNDLLMQGKSLLTYNSNLLSQNPPGAARRERPRRAAPPLRR